jgi:dihydrolipoamide dehydrogenase
VQVSQNVVTYEEQILDAELPGSIIIAGSGAIGVEFAYVMKNFGVDVTIVEFLDRMVPTEDADVSKELLKHYKKLGIKACSAPRSSPSRTPDPCARDGFSSRRRRPAGPGGRQVAVRDRLRPRTEGYGLEATGVALTERGAIAIDDYMPDQRPRGLRHR